MEIYLNLARRMKLTGMRPFEASGRCALRYRQVRHGKSKNARRNVPLTTRVILMLRRRQAQYLSGHVFPGENVDRPILVTSLDHQHSKLRGQLNKKFKEEGADISLPPDFVLHSLRHTMLTRLEESGVDAFTIMRIAGQSSITVGQRYVHPSPEAVERAFGAPDGMG